MEAAVQIASTVICGFLFEQVLKVMGQKQLGEITRILSWVLVFFWLCVVIAQVGTWAGDQVKAVHDFFEPFRNFIKK